MNQLLQLDASYNFSDYFKLNYYTEDILAYFGYAFEPKKLQLPTTQRLLNRLDDLRQ